MIRIAITGPESTGKSQLSEQLAVHYNTTYAPEFARDYLNHLNRPYCFEDLTEIAKGQINNEKIATRHANKILFCDTELTVIKIWAEYKYHKCPEWVSKQINRIHYDLYLLCYIDLPWEYDPLREHPHLREFFFYWFEKEFMARKQNYIVIKGLGQERFENAVAAVEKLKKSTTTM